MTVVASDGLHSTDPPSNLPTVKEVVASDGLHSTDPLSNLPTVKEVVASDGLHSTDPPSDPPTDKMVASDGQPAFCTTPDVEERTFDLERSAVTGLPLLITAALNKVTY